MGREGRFTGRRAGRRLENGEWSRFELSMCVYTSIRVALVCVSHIRYPYVAHTGRME